MKYIFTLLILSSYFLNAQRIYNYGLNENFNWSNFDLTQFIFATITCTMFIITGLKLTKDNKHKIHNTIGVMLIIIGGIGSLVYLIGPVIEIFKILWLFIIGIIFFCLVLYIFLPRKIKKCFKLL